ncbi:MAG: proline--tRNA ligase [Anaerolineae bacterium]|nr:proline--tRNA ligase [Anaerolineae bacterium]
MRFSRMFARTLREAPAEAELVSHQLSVRAGLVRQMAAGIYSYLPLGKRVLNRIAAIVRDEMEAIEGQEILMPVVQPAQLWRTTGRYEAPSPGPALVRFEDRSGHEMVLAMTHEEAVTDLARQEIRSYRQLPQLVYHIQTKFRDEPRARGGLMRVREFVMKDAYSFHADEDSLDATYAQVYRAYLNIASRCGLNVLPVQAAAGMMGGSDSHEFVFLHDAGEDTVMLCPQCGYAANLEAARLEKTAAPMTPAAPLEQIATPGVTTIAALAAYLGIQTRQTLKAVFYATDADELVFAVIRGDLEVNEAKLSSAVGNLALAPATAELLERAGIVAGYASPIGIRDVRIVADDSILTGNNWVAGANEAGFHYLNVNYPRDLQVDTVTDLALAREGDLCVRCGGSLQARRGIEVGHIFKLGSRYSEAMGASYLDADGIAHPPLMGCYGIGLGRLLACIIEAHHDNAGIVWPVSVAPCQVHLVALGGRDASVDAAAEALYEELGLAGWEVLYDDRPERAGVKFNDADLIGVPVRLTVSNRTIEQNGVELLVRGEQQRQLVPREVLHNTLAEILGKPT